MSEDLTELQRNILKLILTDAHRPNAITSVLRRRKVECDQNSVVQALLDLEKRKLVERISGKAWGATDSAEDLVE
jgi:hypothetical protein